ncbi:Vancomycin B-type resistance protein VanW [Bacillus mycoides]|nr:Vancomycin B-type resistance protein VanW [Bacillus mycoides]
MEEDHCFVKKTDGQVYRQNKVYKKIVNRVTGNLVEKKLIMENDCLVKYEVDNEKIEGSL